jgi:hypothetical protein
MVVVGVRVQYDRLQRSEFLDESFHITDTEPGVKE